jgi:hypothetical protein
MEGLMKEVPAEFRFRYRLHLADYLVLSDARNRLGPVGRHLWPWRYLIWYGLFIAFLWWIGGLTLNWRIYLHWKVGGWILFVLILPFLIDLVVNQVILRWSFHIQAASKADIAVDIGEASVDWKLGHSAGQMGWPAIRYRVVLKDRVILFLDKIQGITLPRRGLVAGDWDAFLALVRRKSEEALPTQEKGADAAAPAP